MEGGGWQVVKDLQTGMRGFLEWEPWSGSALSVSEGIRNSSCFCSQQRAPGKVLLDAVCNHLNLVEGDYFGLEFPDHKKITVGDVKGMLLLYSLFD